MFWNMANCGLQRGSCRIWVLLLVALFSCFIKTSQSEDSSHEVSATPGLPTVTVRGFLNFRTTVDGTVIVFTPASEGRQQTTQPKILLTSAETQSLTPSSNNVLLQEDKSRPEKEENAGVSDLEYISPSKNSLVGLFKTQISNLNMLEKEMEDSYLQHIADNNVVTSAVQGDNVLDKMKKIPTYHNQYPTGLVTVLGGTSVEGKSTTDFITSVIGTYIDGKYAQILQSISQSVTSSLAYLVTPTNSLSVSSEATNINQSPSTILEKKVASSLTESTYLSTSWESKLKTPSTPNQLSADTTSTFKLSDLSEISSGNDILSSSTTRNDYFSSETAVSNVEQKSSKIFLTPSFSSQIVSAIFDSKKPTQSLDSVIRSTSFATYSSVAPITSAIRSYSFEESTAHSNSKPHRSTVSSRTRFLSLRRPSQSVRLNRFKVKLTTRHDSTDVYNVTIPSEDDEMEEENNNKPVDEIDIATTEGLGFRVDPAKVVFQETTITSEVTLHVGRRKSIRTLTITTSIPLNVHPTDIRDILMSESSVMDHESIDISHYVVTRTFTATERAVKTSIVPIFDGKSTTYHSVTESFYIMKIITAYRTMPSGGASVIESILDEPDFEATLEEAANIRPSVIQSAPADQSTSRADLQPSVAVPTTQNVPMQLSNPFLSLGHALSNNPLAAVYLGLQQLDAQMTLYSTITDTSTYVTTDTVYSTKTIRLYDGRSIKYRTFSEPISTKKATITTTITSVQPYFNTLAYQKQQQLQKLIGNTRLPNPEPQYSTKTSVYTTVTTATSLSTRIYTLIYNGFSTKFKTVTSTSTYPTTATVTSTVKVPLSATQVNNPFPYHYSI